MLTHSWFRIAACMAVISPITAFAAPGQTAPPPAAAPAAPSQTAAPPIAFEVASIKPSPPIDPMRFMSGQAHVGMHIDAARVDFGFTSLMALIVTAYKVEPFQVTGPAWMNTTMFDIVANLPHGATKEQVPEMLQALLADRFKMTMHRENKEHPEFSLLVAKGGAKLTEADPEPAADPAAADEPAKPGEMVSDSPEGRIHIRRGKDGSMGYSGPGMDVTASFANGLVHMDATRITMKGLARMLSGFAGNPVVDKTELKGSYKMVFDFSTEEMMAVARASGAMAPGAGAGAAGQNPASAASDPSGPSVTTMIQKYGLRLVPQKTPVDFIVIDHIEKTPTEN